MPKGTVTAQKAAALVDHYQNTHELVSRLWAQRNKTFLLLLGVVGAAAMFVNEESLKDLLQMLRAYLQRDGAAPIPAAAGPAYRYFTEESFPFKIIHGMFLVSIFYLMVSLYHRSLNVLRNYAYLGALEHEIRHQLDLIDGVEVGFTRESSFYWDKRPILMALVKYFYILIIAGMLGLFFYLRVLADFYPFDPIMLAIDALVGTPTLLVFLAYAWQSIAFDSARVYLDRGLRGR